MNHMYGSTGEDVHTYRDAGGGRGGWLVVVLVAVLVCVVLLTACAPTSTPHGPTTTTTTTTTTTAQAPDVYVVQSVQPSEAGAADGYVDVICVSMQHPGKTKTVLWDALAQLGPEIGTKWRCNKGTR